MLSDLIKKALKKLGYRLTKSEYSAPTSIIDFFLYFDRNQTFLLIDVGANEGQTLDLFLSYFPNCKIYSFEPDPDCFAKLLESYSENNFVELYQFALSDSKTNTLLFRNLNSKLNSLAPLHENYEGRFGHMRDTVEIQTIRLDDFIESKRIKRINLLKIDVQGFEGKVISGTKKAIAEAVFDWIFVEITFSKVYEVENSFYSIQEILKNKYSLYSILDLNYLKGYILSHCDFVYKRIGL